MTKPTARPAKSKPAAITPQNSEITRRITDNLLDDYHWKHIFLPTLTHALYISRKPFMDWTINSSAFLAIVQNVFNLSFPNIDVALSMKDKLTDTVCQTESQLVCTPDIKSKSGLSKDKELKVIVGQWNS
jgi:hypothetical protein